MNYTRPNEENHIDDPKDWLNSALIFTRALSLLLRENEGIVVKLQGDMFNPVSESNNVFVVRKNNQIHIQNADPKLEEGSMIWFDSEE